MEPAELRDIRRAQQQPVSLDRAVEEDQRPLIDLVPADGPKPEEEVVAAAESASVHRLLLELPPRERRVLELRFGLGCPPCASLTEISRLVGVSRTQIRNIELRALARLRRSPEARRLLRAG
jgi:RNA polymerase primary sigma factor